MTTIGTNAEMTRSWEFWVGSSTIILEFKHILNILNKYIPDIRDSIESKILGKPTSTKMGVGFQKRNNNSKTYDATVFVFQYYSRFYSGFLRKEIHVIGADCKTLKRSKWICRTSYIWTMNLTQFHNVDVVDNI